MDTLEKLFGSPVRSKLLKLFLMSPDSQFSALEASRQARIPLRTFLAEVERLVRLRLLKSAIVKLPEPSRRRRRSRRDAALPRLVRTRVFAVNPEFPLFAELRMLVLKSAPHAKGELATKIRRLGNMKLAVLAGVFIDNPSSRIDLLLVGDAIRRSRMNAFIRWLETEVGKQLNYVTMSSQEFRYRRDMFDRFVSSILEGPHETVINKLGV